MTSKVFFDKAGTVALLFSLSLFVSTASPSVRQETATHAEHVAGTRRQAKGLVNFGEVTPYLYRGGQPSSEGLHTLKEMGVDVVVDMRSGDRKEEEAAVTKLGMRYFKISWHCPFPTDKPFAKFLRIIRGNPGKKIFVHCRLGDDRSGMAVAAYRMAEQGWSADEAMKEMKEFGFSRSHHLICPSLAGYEKSFPERWKASEAFKELRAEDGKK